MATASSAASSSPNTDSSAEDSSKIPPGAVAGLAVEGVVIALAFAGLAYIIWRNRVLRRKVKRAEATASAQQQLQQQYQWQHPPSSHAGIAPPHMDAYGGYGRPATTNTYNELPGPEPVGSELPTEPRSPKSPATKFQG
ncbi:uncharacterized protein F4812DRAFT_123478 [Daldinia caldariorum]|uniref:uncharacterized protein n=1 Tax=Daldinia caldariorum TaxID=326644 RepID=UPI002007F16A|nr:uncharacterized protein F4812DRAFT_123478 [Daldinia caldariorum]KAI1465442.1 hypothetical protein F4812DRAFT_123478 [Daldinia caldariorum]